MTSKTRVVLDLNTRVKVIHASKRDKLSVKQIMKMFNIGKTQVYEILKKKTEILMFACPGLIFYAVCNVP